MPKDFLFEGATATGGSDEFDLSGYETNLVQVYGTNAPDAVVQIETRADVDASPWFTVATTTLPAGNGQQWSVPPVGRCRAEIVTYNAGNIFVALERVGGARR